MSTTSSPTPPAPAANGPARSSYVPHHLRNRSPAAPPPSSAPPPPRAAPGLLSRPGVTGGGWTRVGRSGDREFNPSAESDAAADPAPFDDQHNKGINLDAYKDVSVQTSGRELPPPVSIYAEIDLGAALNDNICRDRASVAVKKAAADVNMMEDEEAVAAAKQAEEVAVYPDWSSLPEDLIGAVMRLLEHPDLLHAGAVCTSWCAAHYTFRIPIKDASPCLLYSCAGDDDDTTACLYSTNAGTSFKFRLPGGPAFRRRYVIGSGHGWVVAADEASNLQAFNPLTGAQVDLPPVTGLHHIESASDDQGRPAYNMLEEEWRSGVTVDTYTRRELRLYLYNRVYLSCKPSAGAECIVLLIHSPLGEMSFARVGDDRWTLITCNETVPWNGGYCTATYNNNDGLFYVVTTVCSICAFDLKSGATPVVRKIIKLYDPSPTAGYIVFAPWGDVLLAQRNMTIRTLDTPVQLPADYANEVNDPSTEGYTYEILLYKVDIHNEKLVKISSSDLQGHALFLGFNSPILVSTDDFPRLKPNSVYLADDNWEYILYNMFGYREVGTWNFETEKVESLDDVIHSTNPWLNWPPPIWITPSLI